MKKKRTAVNPLAAVAIVLATLSITLIVQNLSLGDQQLDARIEQTAAARDPLFQRTMGRVLGPSFTQGNHIETLQNGEEIFPAMLAAIRSAQHTVTLETYIFYSGATAREFADALIDRSRAGVRVHVLLDWFGGQINDDITEQMKTSGIDLHWYHAPSWKTLPVMNNRTHRKILVVDGRSGFTGGADIADKWRGNARNPEHWRDTHFRISGPAVGQLQAAFVDNWQQATGRLLHGPHYFPELAGEGALPTQVFTSSRGGGSESMQLMYLLSIASARQTIDLSSAYFIPEEAAIAQLATAAKRGVRVRIIVPGEHIDWNVVRRASRHRWGALLDAGVEIHEYRPTMYHVKLLVVDGIWTSAGSSNFDPRSFSINDECNLNVFSEAFAQTQIAIFERDLQKAKRVTLEAWHARGWTDKTLDALASLIGEQL